MARKSQLDKILDFLQTGKQLTSAEAAKRFGVTRLPARILDLRNEGFLIYTNTRRVDGRTVTQYRLDNSQQR